MNSTQASKYLASGGDHCPYCEKKTITSWPMFKNDRRFRCEYCLEEWTNIYTLTGVDGFKRVEAK